MSPKNLNLDIYLREIEIAERVQELGEEVSEKYQDVNPLLISVLSGAFIFTSDLIRNIDVPHDLLFTKIKSYEGTHPGSTIDFQLPVDGQVKGRDVLIIEDIIDTGRTADFLISHLRAKQAKSIGVISLLWKPSKYEFDYKLDFVGFSIPDIFVLGYGMDYNEYGRNLKDIYILNQHKNQ